MKLFYVSKLFFLTLLLSGISLAQDKSQHHKTVCSNNDKSMVYTIDFIRKASGQWKLLSNIVLEESLGHGHVRAGAVFPLYNDILIQTEPSKVPYFFKNLYRSFQKDRYRFSLELDKDHQARISMKQNIFNSKVISLRFQTPYYSKDSKYRIKDQLLKLSAVWQSKQYNFVKPTISNIESTIKVSLQHSSLENKQTKSTKHGITKHTYLKCLSQ